MSHKKLQVKPDPTQPTIMAAFAAQTARKTGTKAAEIHSWADRDRDYSTSYFFQKTRDPERYQPYLDRFGITEYIAHDGVKLRIVAQIATQVCNKHKRKLLIFTDWPLT